MQMRKIASAALGAFMAGATLAAPVLAASTLEDFPAPFVMGGEADFVVVVGADAQPSDVLGAADITARLGGDVVSPSDTTTVSGDATQEDINIGDAISTDLGTIVDDSDLDFMFDGTISFDGKTWNTHEEITLGASSPSLNTSLTSGTDDYMDNVYMEATAGSIGYYYVFDEAINLTARVDADDNLIIDFLGQTLTITDITDNDTMVAEVGTKVTLVAGESATVEGKTIELIRTGTDNALVSVGGQQESIDEGDTETVNGLRVKVDSVFDDDGVENDLAVLIAGDEAEETIDDGDEYIGEDEDDPKWVWDIGGFLLNAAGSTGATGPKIGVVNDFVLADEDGDEDAGVPALTAGGSIAFPENFVTLSFDQLIPTKDELKVDISFDTGIDASDNTTYGTSEDGAVIEFGKEETFVVTVGAGTDQATDRVYLLRSTGTGAVDVLYVNSDNDVVFHGTVAQGSTPAQIGYVDYGDTTGAGDVSLWMTTNTSGANNSMLNITDDQLDENISIAINVASNELAQLGANADSADAAEMNWTDGVTSRNIGTKDENLRTSYGIRIGDPDSNGDSDKAALWIPADVVEAQMSLSRSGVVSTGTTSGQITSSVTKLDTDVSSAASEPNMILVGGPCVNDLVAQLNTDDKYPYGCSDFPNGYLIELVNDAFADGQVAMVVAGYTAEQTKEAAGVVQNYGSAGWTGTRHEVLA